MSGDIIPICDVQSRRLVNGFKLTKVGVTGVKKPVRVRRDWSKIELACETLTCDIDVFVDLPSTQKGSHLSRNLEVISEIVDDSVRSPVRGLEVLSADICRKLLERHEYATIAEVSVEAPYFRERNNPGGKRTLESYRLIARAVGRRDGKLLKSIGVEVIGMTACPCAMETIRADRVNNGDDVVEGFPTISHNQRNICTVLMEVPEEFDVEANDLIDLVEMSFSSPTFEILKRSDEGAVVVNAHKNPKFVEDVVREVLGKILIRYRELPDDVLITVRSESEESIHKHNAFAERVTTLGELREMA